jgi:hypothetical protein
VDNLIKQIKLELHLYRETFGNHPLCYNIYSRVKEYVFKMGGLLRRGKAHE